MDMDTRLADPVTVTLGSTNPAKISGVRKAFEAYFASPLVTGYNVESGVPNQPFDDELYIGARNRAMSAMKRGKSDYYVGIEGGIIRIDGKCYSTTCAVVLNSQLTEHTGYSLMFEVPETYMEIVRRGYELGEATDMLTGERDTKKGKGLIGVLSLQRLDREKLVTESVLVALMHFVNTQPTHQPAYGKHRK